MKKTLIGLLTALMLTFAGASPAQQDRHSFCVGVAEMAAQAGAASRLGMPKDVFEQAMAEVEESLAATDLSKSEQKQVIVAMREAYYGGKLPQKAAGEAYAACMSQKEV